MLIVGLIIIVTIPIALTWKALKMSSTVEVEEDKSQQTVQQVIPSYTPRIIEEPKPVEEVERPIQTEESSLDISPALAKLLQTTVPHICYKILKN